MVFNTQITVAQVVVQSDQSVSRLNYKRVETALLQRACNLVYGNPRRPLVYCQVVQPLAGQIARYVTGSETV